MKRQLLDILAEGHDFDVPSMVEAEFNQIWQQLTHEASHEEDPRRLSRKSRPRRTTIVPLPCVASAWACC
jgi:FKBP-type peptidyl-prolyl cis-trans isomerase (trigger factor)